jgi:uncharacterized membrane protein YebE (DUF533 family)
MQTAPQTGQTLSTSMFYMWRCVITIAHADERVDEKEIAYLNKVFDGMVRAYGLTPAQRKIFDSDIKNPQKMSDLLPYINDPAARSQLTYFCGLMAMADGVMDPREDQIIRKLRTDQMLDTDLAEIRKHVQAEVATEMFRHELRMSEIRPQQGFSAIIDRFLLWMGFDILENDVEG